MADKELTYTALPELYNKRMALLDVRKDQFGKMWLFPAEGEPYVICGAEMNILRKRGRFPARLNARKNRICTQPAGWGTDHPGWGPCKRHVDMPEEALDFWMQHVPKKQIRKKGFLALLQEMEKSEAMIDSFKPAYDVLRAAVMQAAKNVDETPSSENLKILTSVAREFRDTTFQHQKITEQLLPRVKEYKQLAIAILTLGRRFCESLNLGAPAYEKFVTMADETFGHLFRGVGKDAVKQCVEIDETDMVVEEGGQL